MAVYLIATRLARSLRGNGFARFTTIVSVLSVALGCIALIVAMSVLRGYEETIERTALRFAAPIEVRSLTTPLISDAAEAAQAIRGMEGVTGTELLITKEALGRTRTGVDGVVLVGMSPARARTEIAPLLVEGSMTGRHDDCVIGADLARKLALHVGDTITIYTADAGTAAAPTILRGRIGGIIHSGMQQQDESVVLLPTNVLRERLRMEAGVASSIAVEVSDITRVKEISRAIADRLGPRAYVQTYRERFGAMYSWIDLQREPIPIVLGLISIVAVFTVISSLVIAVVEKTGTIAVLRCLGLAGRKVAWVVLLHGLRIGIAGCVLGCLTAFAFCWVQATWSVIRLDGAIYYVNALPVSLSPFPYVVVVVVSLLLCVLASLIPMWLAGRISPVRALRFAQR